MNNEVISELILPRRFVRASRRIPGRDPPGRPESLAELGQASRAGWLALGHRRAVSSRLIMPATRFAWFAGHALGVASLFWVGALVSRADMHYVSLNGTNDSVNGYITWGGAATNIQWAVNAASGATADTVLVSNGTYNLTNPRVARAVGLGDEIDHMMKVYLGLFKTYKTSDRKFCH